MLLLGFTPVGNRFTERNLTIFIRKYRCVVGQDNPFQFLFHTMYVCMYGLFDHIRPTANYLGVAVSDPDPQP